MHQAFIPNSSVSPSPLLTVCNLFLTLPSPVSLKESWAQASSQEPQEEGIETQNTRSLITVACWDMMSTAANSFLKCRKKGHRWFHFKILVQTERTKFPSGLICWDFSMYLELPSWSPDNEFLAVRAGNPKNTVPQILKNSDFFFLLRLQPAVQLLVSLHTLPYSLFLDWRKYLASEQYLISEFTSKVALWHCWDIGSPMDGGTKRLLSVSLLIHNIPQRKQKHLEAYPTSLRKMLGSSPRAPQMMLLAFNAPCSSQSWNAFKMVPKNRFQDQ